MIKILQITSWVLSLTIVGLTLGFVNKAQQKLTFTQPQVTIDNQIENKFVNEKEIIEQIINRRDTGALILNNYDIKKLEEKQSNTPF